MYAQLPCDRNACGNMVYGEQNKLAVAINLIDIQASHGQEKTEYLFCGAECAKMFLEDKIAGTDVGKYCAH